MPDVASWGTAERGVVLDYGRGIGVPCSVHLGAGLASLGSWDLESKASVPGIQTVNNRGLDRPDEDNRPVQDRLDRQPYGCPCHYEQIATIPVADDSAVGQDQEVPVEKGASAAKVLNIMISHTRGKEIFPGSLKVVRDLIPTI